MKKIIITFLLSAGLFVSCTDLEVTPTSFVTEDKYFITQDDAVASVTAVYASLSLDPGEQSLFGRNLYFLTDMGSDYAAAGVSATNPSNEIPRATSSPLGIVSERYVEDASFLRLKLITLGYTLPKSTSKKLGAKSVKFYVSAENLITWTKYSGYDPEVSSYEQNNLYPGIDFGSYPNSKTFISGLNVTF